MIQQLTAGIDIGGTNLALGLVDMQGNILRKRTYPTQRFSTPESLVARVGKEIKDQLRSIGASAELLGIGIGAPNGNFFNGAIESASNLKWKGVIPLAKYFQDSPQAITLLTNDANAAAMGEKIFGGAKNINDFLYITLGTGLGSGIVANGELVYGHDGLAGEIGHVIIHPEGRPCGCGRKGCLETYCSATGLKHTYLEMLWKQGKTEKGLKHIRTRDIYDKAVAGDENARAAFEYTGQILGLALANSVAFSSPKAIFLSGGLALAGDYLFNPTLASFESNLLKIYKNKVQILPSQLREKEASVLGAASLVWNHLKIAPHLPAVS